MKKLAIVLGFLAVLVAAAWISGSEPELDAVLAAESELGVDLEAARVRVGEVSLFTVSAGPKDGRPVLLLHGFPEFWYAWYRHVALLSAEGFRVHAPDQRGYAGSDKPPDVMDYAVEKLAADAANLIAASGHESACVAAHDWGGGVGWALAFLHPERVRRFVVFDTPHPDVWLAGPSQEETTSWYRTVFQIPLVPELLSRTFHWRLVTGMLERSSAPGAFPEEKLALWRSAWDRDGSYGKMVNWYRASFRNEPRHTGEPRRLAIPTLVVAAKEDAFIGGDLTRRSVELLDAGRLLELDYGTHWVLQEEPEKTARIIADFCAEP